MKIMIFGREPAAFVAVLEALLVLALSFGMFGLTQDTVVNIVAVVVAGLGVYTAAVTRDTLLGVVVGLVKAIIALSVGYGLQLSTEQTGALIAVTTVLVGLFQRTQTAPAIAPSFRDPSPAEEIPVPVESTRAELGHASPLVIAAFVLLVLVVLIIVTPALH